MSRTSIRSCLQVLAILLVGPSCEKGGSDEPMGESSSSTSAGSTSTAGDDTTSTGQSGSTTSSSTSTTTGEESTGSLDPEVVCRTWPDPALCPYGGDIGLPEPQDCVPIDVYVYDAPGACDVEF